jgi:hypothetical protein
LRMCPPEASLSFYRRHSLPNCIQQCRSLEAQLARNSAPWGNLSMHYSVHKTITGPCQEPVELSPHTRTQYLGPRSILIIHYSYIYLQIIQVPLDFSGYVACIYHFSHSYHIST